MWRWLAAACLAGVTLSAQAPASVTVAWELGGINHEGATWQLERNGVVFPCESVTVTPSDRRCTALVPAGPATFRLRGVSETEGPGEWSVSVEGRAPGTFTISTSGEFDAPMTEFVSAAGGDNADLQTAVSAAFDSTGANLIVINGAWFGSGQSVTVSDNKGNTYTALTLTDVNNYAQQMFYVLNPTVGSGHTVTVAGTVNIYVSAIGGAFSGANAFSAESAGGTTTGGTSVQPGSITPGDNNCLIVTGLAQDSNGAITVNGGFSEATDYPGELDSHVGNALVYLIQTTAAAANPTLSWASSVPAAARSAVFTSTGGAGIAIPIVFHHRQRNF